MGEWSDTSESVRRATRSGLVYYSSSSSSRNNRGGRGGGRRTTATTAAASRRRPTRNTVPTARRRRVLSRRRLSEESSITSPSSAEELSQPTRPTPSPPKHSIITPDVLDVVLINCPRFSQHLGNRIYKKYIIEAAAVYDKLGSGDKRDLIHGVVSSVEKIIGGRFMVIDGNGVFSIATDEMKYRVTRDRMYKKPTPRDYALTAMLTVPSMAELLQRPAFTPTLVPLDSSEVLVPESNKMDASTKDDILGKALGESLGESAESTLVVPDDVMVAPSTNAPAPPDGMAELSLRPALMPTLLDSSKVLVSESNKTVTSTKDEIPGKALGELLGQSAVESNSVSSPDDAVVVPSNYCTKSQSCLLVESSKIDASMKKCEVLGNVRGEAAVASKLASSNQAEDMPSPYIKCSEFESAKPLNMQECNNSLLRLVSHECPLAESSESKEDKATGAVTECSVAALIDLLALSVSGKQPLSEDLLDILARMESHEIASVGQSVDSVILTMAGLTSETELVTQSDTRPRCLDVILTKNRAYTSLHLGNQLHAKYILDAMAEYNEPGKERARKREIAQGVISRVESSGGCYMHQDPETGTFSRATHKSKVLRGVMRRLKSKDSDVICNACDFTPHLKVMKLANIQKCGDLCAQCTEDKIQLDKEARKKQSLRQRFEKQREDKAPCSRKTMHLTVFVKDFVQHEFGPSLAARLMPYLPTAVPLESTELETHVSDGSLHKNLSAEFGGAWFDKDVDMGSHPNILQRKANKLKLVKVPLRDNQPKEEQNFAIIVPSGYDQNHVDAFSRREQKYIDKGVLAKRHGLASGIFVPENACLSFNENVRHPTTFYRASSDTGVQMRAFYLSSETNEATVCAHGYNAVESYQLASGQRLEDVQLFVEFRHIMLRDALNYIISMASIEAGGIPSPARDGKYLGRLAQILHDHPSLPIEDALLCWMCQSGEHRYHQALACHPDGKHANQPYEIYTLFQRQGVEKTDGLLYLPLDNICLKIRVNTEMMVCNFTQTQHVPDKSRNTYNFSRVHSPMFNMGTYWDRPARGKRKRGS